ncbi:Cation/H+ exchanger [Auriculariales sp. MPI-PUGE-AT-0066]|nr:Cation/H+ exchanger [Auriculariales sp. MPI-PUGE-AT-0066]
MLSEVAALSYHEPTTSTTLILAAFALILNFANHAFDRLLSCGLLIQVLVGAAFGIPGAKWLDESTQQFVVQAGYLGLILLVYEGGLSASIPLLRQNLLLCVAVAATGILLPMGLSFTLQPLMGATALQAFAAGAALCSTSLGTTFTVLTSSNLTQSKLGVVLSGAAMMDDVVGLVLVQVIANLGSSTGTGGRTRFDPISIVRPVAASLGLAIFAPLVCRFVALPLAGALSDIRSRPVDGIISRTSKRRETAFVVQTLVLYGCVAAAGYAGASVLLAAYLAGACISWWDDNMYTFSAASAGSLAEIAKVDTSGHAIYIHFYHQVVSKFLCPFFFASIGFAIPLRLMFTGPVLWRGIVYSVLMVLGKVACGVWLIRLPTRLRVPQRADAVAPAAVPPTEERSNTASINHSQPACETTAKKPDAVHATADTAASRRSRSLYPAVILGCAMVARGEIGFLVSALAASKGIFGRPSIDAGGEPTSANIESDIFLVVTWAIVICTMVGPIAVGIMVRRVRWLEATKAANSIDGSVNVLGEWGIGVGVHRDQES